MDYGPSRQPSWSTEADSAVMAFAEVVDASESADPCAEVTDYLTRSRRLFPRDWTLPSPGDDPVTDVAVARRSVAGGECSVRSIQRWLRIGECVGSARPIVKAPSSRGFLTNMAQRYVREWFLNDLPVTVKPTFALHEADSSAVDVALKLPLPRFD
ncbi:hypothetical protein SAMN04488052_1122 [Aquisalimonas asiatica]|uniref:Uncharacterized protein n=1 Tax=Aquisalimonas asiatica TaxID=406100 RepID=A0A1H8VEQ0_9GAMM|nr:hypothetical protein SAMN04488052_1122 [Aquisalimonas asiatica]